MGRRLTCSEIIENNFMVDMAFELWGPNGMIRSWIIMDKDIIRKRYLPLSSSIPLILSDNNLSDNNYVNIISKMNRLLQSWKLNWFILGQLFVSCKWLEMWPVSMAKIFM